MLERFLKKFRESVSTPETPKTFPIYSGTSLNNYKMSAYITPEGVFYDKSRNPRNFFKEFYFFDSPEYAFEHALVRAFELRDLPVIVGGNISMKYSRRHDRLPVGTIVPVSDLWIPTPDITIENMINKLTNREGYEKLMSNFAKVDPASVLE